LNQENENAKVEKGLMDPFGRRTRGRDKHQNSQEIEKGREKGIV